MNYTEFEVDGIRLDPENREFSLALQYALESNMNIYLTGKAGSGKTTFLKYLKKITTKNMVVLAPTGVAAINAGGQTIHSFFKIEPSLYVPGDKRLRTHAPTEDPDKSTIYDNFRYKAEQLKVIKSLELLVIDEVSMVRADLLDVVDTLLRVYRKNHAPFGGVQVILIGDTFQLPPVIKGPEKELLSRFYGSEFFFSAKAYLRCKPLYIELKKIYRQNERDFIDLLNRIRINHTMQEDYSTLNRRLSPTFQPANEDRYIVLATTNEKVNNVNARKLDELTTPLVHFPAEVDGEFPEGSRPTETNLKLKKGAQVMFIKNDPQKRYFNGKIATIIDISENKIVVEIEDGNKNRQQISVDKDIWYNVVYHWDEEKRCIEEKVIGIFKQYPIRLAWAITVHKSQGLTFEKVIADIGDSFTSGQVYVALSRCTSMNGLVLTSRITPWSIKTDPRVIRFAQNETPETLLIGQLSECKADFYYDAARKALRAHNVSGTIENYLTAIKYRNDSDTDTFKRYVSVWMKKLFRADESRNALSYALVESKLQIREKEEEIASLSAQLDDEKDNEHSLRQRINALESAINSYKSQVDELKEAISDAKQKCDEKDAMLSQVRSDLETLNQKVFDLETENLHLKEDINVRDAEIVRISNIRWYQKLFGSR